MEDSSPTDGSTATDVAPPRPGAGEPERTGPSVCYVVQDRGSGEVTFDRETVEGLHAGGEPPVRYSS